ncbi:helix-turn-helix domain-containing protein, partial [Klebsiella pneumoniae]
MARPKSEDKKQALLEAATAAFAQSGIAASTSAIARSAGVAEGTLFRYFATKDELLNELGNDSNLLIVFYVQIVPDDFVMQLHR